MTKISNYQVYIDGEWTPSLTGETFSRFSPVDGRLVGNFQKCGCEDADRVVKAARRAFDEGEWPHWSASERAKVLHKAARLIETRTEQLAQLEAADTGALIGMCHDMMGWCVEVFKYFAGVAESAMAGRYYELDESRMGLVVREPIGVAVLVGPWNFPLSEMVWKIAPALAAGCTVIAKPPSLTPSTILELANILEEAGLPAGVYNAVTGPGSTFGQALVEHPSVDKVSLTGDNRTGVQIVHTGAEDMKRVTMELGGKSPQVVFADAEWDLALQEVSYSVFRREGQVCIAGSRLIIEESIHDHFVEDLIKIAKDYRIGDPMDPATQMGPMISEGQRQTVLDYIKKGKEEGATLVYGGGIPQGKAYEKGWYIQPTIFTDVTPEMVIAQDEIFGPVMSVMKFKTEEEAIELANKTRFGLAGGVWTTDLARAIKVAKSIRAGSVWINQYGTIEYEMPFGGYKQSGFGRELGPEGIQDFTEMKSIHVRHPRL